MQFNMSTDLYAYTNLVYFLGKKCFMYLIVIN